MAQHSVRFEQFFAAPRPVVFGWFAQHQNMARLFGGRLKRTVAASGDTPEGLGSVREVGVGLLRLEETITRFEPPEVIEYRVTRGWPITDHLGRLCFSEIDGGTHLDYAIEFKVAVPGLGGIFAGVLCASWRRHIHRVVDAVSGA